MSERQITAPIGQYEYMRYDDVSEVFQPWDERAPEVAARVAALIRERMADVRVEHVGSSAIPGCDGKGPVDLLLLYPLGRLAAARDALDGLGFQRQQGADPFPEERPMRLGTYDYDGETFRLHVHVVQEGVWEVREALHFRDRLRADPELVEEYIESKRASIAALNERPDGSAANIAYNAGKEPFIRRILAELGDAEADS